MLRRTLALPLFLVAALAHANPSPTEGPMELLDAVRDRLEAAQGLEPHYTPGGGPRRTPPQRVWKGVVAFIARVADRAASNRRPTQRLLDPEDKPCFEADGLRRVLERLYSTLGLQREKKDAARAGLDFADKFLDERCKGRWARVTRAWEESRVRFPELNEVMRSRGALEWLALAHTTCPPGSGGGVCLPSNARLRPEDVALAAAAALVVEVPGAAVGFEGACSMNPGACQRMLDEILVTTP